MFRLWAKIFQNNHMLKDICIEDGSDDTQDSFVESIDFDYLEIQVIEED